MMYAHTLLRFPDVRKLAVLRANKVGDFVFSLPALQSLKRAYPDAQLTLLGLPWHQAFLRDRRAPSIASARCPASGG